MNIYITNYLLYDKWKRIEKFLEFRHDLREYQQGLIIDDEFLISVHRTKMRPLGQLDWSWYTPKTLAIAMNECKVLEYYEKMLKDKRSDTNKWKNKRKEMELKTLYAVKAGKAEFI